MMVAFMRSKSLILQPCECDMMCFHWTQLSCKLIGDYRVFMILYFRQSGHKKRDNITKNRENRPALCHREIRSRMHKKVRSYWTAVWHKYTFMILYFRQSGHKKRDNITGLYFLFDYRT